LGSNSGSKVYPGKNINISHVILDSIPKTSGTPTPTPPATKGPVKPTSPAPKKNP
jgi:hypothetical protein